MRSDQEKVPKRGSINIIERNRKKRGTKTARERGKLRQRTEGESCSRPKLLGTFMVLTEQAASHTFASKHTTDHEHGIAGK